MAAAWSKHAARSAEGARRSTVSFDECVNVQGSDIGDCGFVGVARPVPNGNLHQRLGLGFGEAALDEPGRDAANDGVGVNVTRDHGARTDHRTRPDGDACGDGHAMADPDVVPDGDPIRFAPREEIVIILAQPVGGRAIDRMMLRRAPCRMISGVEPGEFAMEQNLPMVVQITWQC